MLGLPSLRGSDTGAWKINSLGSQAKSRKDGDRSGPQSQRLKPGWTLLGTSSSPSSVLLLYFFKCFLIL